MDNHHSSHRASSSSSSSSRDGKWEHDGYLSREHENGKSHSSSGSWNSGPPRDPRLERRGQSSAPSSSSSSSSWSNPSSSSWSSSSSNGPSSSSSSSWSSQKPSSSYDSQRGSSGSQSYSSGSSSWPSSQNRGSSSSSSTGHSNGNGPSSSSSSSSGWGAQTWGSQTSWSSAPRASYNVPLPPASSSYSSNQSNDSRDASPPRSSYYDEDGENDYGVVEWKYTIRRNNLVDDSSRKRYRSRSPSNEQQSKVRSIEDKGFSSSRASADDYEVFKEVAEEELFKKNETSKIDFDKYDEIPVETSGRDPPPPINSFRDAKFGAAIENNIVLAKYDRPTPVQKYAISIIAQGRDLMACAQTGSGKTAAFLLPILSKMLGSDRNTTQNGKAFPLALILAPTRELACQIQDEARKFAFRTGLTSTVVFGGVPMQFQYSNLERGCHILVGTPGRLLDMYNRGKFSLSRIRFLILDEADRMLDMGFEPQIRKIVQVLDMPSKTDRQTLMFSATFPTEIQQLASSFLNDYVFLTVGRVGSTTELVTQKFVQVEEAHKDQALLDVIKSMKGLILIFVETKKKADELEQLLISHRLPANSIHGDRSQRDRTTAIRNFALGSLPILVATNVAARGLDINNISHVINYDMPADIDDYVHRIGRTGRAGKVGTSTTFISSKNANVVGKLVDLLYEAGQEIPSWLETVKNEPRSSFRGGHRGAHGGGGRGGRFGGRDFRTHNNPSHHSGASSFYGNPSTSARPSQQDSYGPPQPWGPPQPNGFQFQPPRRY